jgi:hypothetical protein
MVLAVLQVFFASKFRYRTISVPFFIFIAPTATHFSEFLQVFFSFFFHFFCIRISAPPVFFFSHSCHGSLPSTSRSRSLPCLAFSLGLVENQLEIPHLSNSDSPALAPFIPMAFPCLVQVLGVSPFSICIFHFHYYYYLIFIFFSVPVLSNSFIFSSLPSAFSTTTAIRVILLSFYQWPGNSPHLRCHQPVCQSRHGQRTSPILFELSRDCHDSYPSTGISSVPSTPRSCGNGDLGMPTQKAAHNEAVECRSSLDSQ